MDVFGDVHLLCLMKLESPVPAIDMEQLILFYFAEHLTLYVYLPSAFQYRSALS